MSSIFTNKLNALNEQLSKDEQLKKAFEYCLENDYNKYKNGRDIIFKVIKSANCVLEYDIKIKHIKEKIQIINDIYNSI
jgi:hypothetical protein